jgi:hypothetical protein
LSLHAQEFGFTSIEGKPLLENIINNELIKNKIVIGKTYTVSLNNYSLTTSTNETLGIKFSCNTAVKLMANTTLNIDTYEQSTLHTQYPQETEYESFSCNTSLIEGELQVINNATINDTNNFYINTKLACIVAGKGKFIVKAENTSSTFIVISGNAIAMDNLSKKLYRLKEKDVITFIPRPVSTGKATEMMRRQNIATMSQLETLDYTGLNNEFSIYDSEQHPYVFITTENTSKFVKLKN